MKIELKKLKIRDLVVGYHDDGDGGVIGYGGKLDIRPPYQREFVYKDAARNAVIDTVIKGFPLNVMYWAERENNPEVPYEIIDGQQRTISICQYVAETRFSVHDKFYHSLLQEEKDAILDYELHVYICKGTDKEKLEWFETINIAGEKLTKQELRNAVYAGSWVSDAKRYFSRTGCAAYKLGHKYVSGTPNRQEYLETAINWIRYRDKEPSIEEYMSKHQHDANANDLWEYFQEVIEWVEGTFLNTYGVICDWGLLYNTHKAKIVNPIKIQKEIDKLMEDSDVEKKDGIFPYVLDGNEKHLTIRQFDKNTRRSVYAKQKGICPTCGGHFTFEEMEGDHIVPWSKGGRTTEGNCQMLCLKCNRMKGAGILSPKAKTITP